MSGRERRWINPAKGLVKILERNLDRVVSRYLYPHLSRVWTPYSWLLERRFVVTDASVSPLGWPSDLGRLRVLLISDIHTGIFLKPHTLSGIVLSLMKLEPDLVAIAGDIVTGHSGEVRPFLDALAPLSRAPLGAWYAYGNHDYFGGDPEEIRDSLGSIGITTLKNESVTLTHGRGQCVLGAIDDLILGKPDWPRLVARHGPPHLLLSHNPDYFYEAEGHGVASMKVSMHSVLRCCSSPGAWGASGFRGVGAPIPRPCLSRSSHARMAPEATVSRQAGCVKARARGTGTSRRAPDVLPPASCKCDQCRE